MCDEYSCDEVQAVLKDSAPRVSSVVPQGSSLGPLLFHYVYFLLLHILGPIAEGNTTQKGLSPHKVLKVFPDLCLCNFQIGRKLPETNQYSLLSFHLSCDKHSPLKVSFCYETGARDCQYVYEQGTVSSSSSLPCSCFVSWISKGFNPPVIQQDPVSVLPSPCPPSFNPQFTEKCSRRPSEAAGFITAMMPHLKVRQVQKDPECFLFCFCLLMMMSLIVSGLSFELHSLGL